MKTAPYANFHAPLSLHDTSQHVSLTAPGSTLELSLSTLVRHRTSVSIRNTKNILFKNLTDVLLSTTTFYLFGYAFLYGEGSSIIGRSRFALQGDKFSQNAGSANSIGMEYALFLFSFSFAATATTIVSGAVAERIKFSSYALYGTCITSLFFPAVAHWVWCEDGWASAYKRKPEDLLVTSGAVDYSGSGAVHIVGGFAALIACVAVGPRVGRFNRGRVMEMPQQSPVFQTIGTIILWFSWYGYNCVATHTITGGKANISALAGVNTTIAASVSGMITMMIDHFTPKQRLEPRRMNNGILTGLVSISGGAGLIPPHCAVFVGIISAFCYAGTSKIMLAFRIDDVVDAISIHLSGGIWGLMSVAFFTSKEKYMTLFPSFGPGDSHKAPCGLFMGCENSGSLLAANVLYMLAIFLWIGVFCTVVIFLLKWTIGLRVDVDHEMKGIDASEHGGRSYTEFQTTVFKFKTASGNVHSMEMRVRAGDAAKFAMALSEVMEGSNRSSGGGSDRDRITRANTSANMVFNSNSPVDPYGEPQSRGSSLSNGSSYTIDVDDTARFTQMRMENQSDGSNRGMRLNNLRAVAEERIDIHPSVEATDNMERTGGGARSSEGNRGKNGVPLDPFEEATDDMERAGGGARSSDDNRGKNGVPLDPFEDARMSSKDENV